VAVSVSSIGNQVFEDANNNGLFDSTERGIAGVVVRFNGLQTTTDSTGTYQFSNIRVGSDSYQVCLDLPIGLASSNGSGRLDAGQLDNSAADPNNYLDSDDNGRVLNGELCSGYVWIFPDNPSYRQNQRVDFGLFRPVGAVTSVAPTTTTSTIASGTGCGLTACRIGNVVWNDLNRNGLADPNEPGVPDVRVELWKYTGPGIAPAGIVSVTDRNGLYQLTGFSAADNYRVCLNPPVGFQSSNGSNAAPDPNNFIDSDDNGRETTPGIICTGYITVNNLLPENERVDIGLVSGASTTPTNPPVTGTIGDSVWNDANNNGIEDPSEQPIVGLELRLYENNVFTGISRTSDLLGHYAFTGLLSSNSYQICVVAPIGFASSNGSKSLTGGQLDTIAADPNNYVDADDNGRTINGSICSGYVTINPQIHTNVRVDFGLYRTVR
jgi:hypothetical protein